MTNVDYMRFYLRLVLWHLTSLWVMKIYTHKMVIVAALKDIFLFLAKSKLIFTIVYIFHRSCRLSPTTKQMFCLWHFHHSFSSETTSPLPMQHYWFTFACTVDFIKYSTRCIYSADFQNKSKDCMKNHNIFQMMISLWFFSCKMFPKRSSCELSVKLTNHRSESHNWMEGMFTFLAMWCLFMSIDTSSVKQVSTLFPRQCV